MRDNPLRSVLSLAAGLIGLLGLLGASEAKDGAPLHFAANLRHQFEKPASLGFNLLDVNSISDLNALPSTAKGVYWLGNGYNTTCAWRIDDEHARKVVSAVKDHPRFSGIYYISDEPHPAICPDAPQRVAERTALIKSIDPRAKTFIIVLNGSADQTEFVKMRDAADYIGVDPYPCNRNNERKGCDYAALRRRIDQAITGGISVERIVPVFQAFGQACVVGQAPYYRLPSVDETRTMLAIWDEKVPMGARPFDMVYSWGKQTRLACPSLSMADGGDYPDLLSVYADYIAEKRKEPRTNDVLNLPAPQP